VLLLGHLGVDCGFRLGQASTCQRDLTQLPVLPPRDDFEHCHSVDERVGRGAGEQGLSGAQALRAISGHGDGLRIRGKPRQPTLRLRYLGGELGLACLRGFERCLGVEVSLTGRGHRGQQRRFTGLVGRVAGCCGGRARHGGESGHRHQHRNPGNHHPPA
jgi:hypothetical protein